MMQRYMKVVRGMVSLYDPGTGRIFVHESVGLTDEEAAKGIYYLGEGITGRVVETAQSIVVPRIGDEPAFLNRTKSRGETLDANLSFICVPILRGRKVMGTISAERLYDNSRLLAFDVEVLGVLAAITAQAVELYLFESFYVTRLEDENSRLLNELKERFRPRNIIGNSKPMLDVYKLIEKVSKSMATVLILGESGVGKELVASAVHYNSRCSRRTLRQIQLRIAAGNHYRERVVRPRERRIHRGDERPPRAFRGSRWRNDFSG